MDDVLEFLTNDLLEEAARPEEQKDFIREVKYQYELLRQVQIHQIEIPMIKAIDRIVVRVFVMVRQLEGVNNQWDADNIASMWFRNKQFRSQMYKKHKAPISGVIQKGMRDVKKGFASSKKGMADYIKRANALMKYFEQHKEVYKAIETKWYNIFGGPRAVVKQNHEAAKYFSEDYKKAMKLPEMKVAVAFTASRFIMGVQDDVQNDIIELIMSPRTFTYALTGS